MTINAIRSLFMYMTFINVIVVSLWFFVSQCPQIHKFVNQFYKISEQKYSEYNYIGIMFYKILIYVFNLVPLLGLYLV